HLSSLSTTTTRPPARAPLPPVGETLTLHCSSPIRRGRPSVGARAMLLVSSGQMAAL
uniref:Uncharacterized protein n=1 Tax=Aegilops tauschii subsp. strangulata TaxID=200361 RepID=A0A453MHK1_AEGTS